jgi:PAS domain S-box-containing protein
METLADQRGVKPYQEPRRYGGESGNGAAIDAAEILAAMPIPVFVKDAEGRLLMMNPACERQWGTSSKGVRGTNLSVLFPAEDVERYSAKDREAFAKRDTLEFEESVWNPETRQHRIVRTVKQPLYDAAGRPRFVVGVALDLTDRARSETEYRTILGTTMDAFWVNDLSGRFCDVNDAYCRMTGYRRDELLSMSIPDVEAIETPEDTRQRIEKLISAGFDRFESRHRRKDGALIDIEVTVTYFPAGRGRLIVFARDISAQNRAKAALLESEEFNRRIIASSSDCIKVLDLEGNLVSMSEGGQRLMEIEQIGRHIGTRWLDFWQKEDQPLVAAAIGEALAGRRGDFRAYCASEKGTPRWWDVVITPILGAGGRPERLLAVSRDITDRMRAEGLAMRATQRFETLAAATSEGIAITVGGWVVDVNERLLQILGYERDELIGRQVRDLIAPDDVAGVLDSIRSGRESQLEHRMLRKDGSVCWVDARGRTIEQDGHPLRLTAIRDVTERRLAEQTIRQSEARLRAHIENSPMAVVAWSSDFRITQWSEEAERMFGWTADEVMGGPLMDLQMVHPDDVPIVRQTMAKLSDGVSRYVVCANRNLTKDGRVIHCVWYNSNLLRDDGSMASILSQVLDVTEQKRAEDDLKCAKLEAEAANDAKSRFLAAVSHDLRQPLSALSLYIGALENRLGLNDDRLFRNMKNCVAGLNDMLSNLLNLSRLEAGVIVPKTSDFALGAVLAKVIAAHEPEARSRRLQLRRCYPDVIVRTDPALFQRIVGNLLANAIRYTDRGGILIGCRRRDGRNWLEIWDTGIGIPADKTSEIFDEFKQLGNSERNRLKGTGLGLAIVAKTAALLNLGVRVRSSPGRGSMFAVELPPGDRLTPIVDHRHPQRSLRIALVDDDVQVADAASYALIQCGHRPVTAESAEKVLQMLGSEAPDILISDYRLAGSETGIGVVDAVREEFGKTVPAIIVTGDTEPALIRLIADKGLRLMHKPLDIAALQAAIAETVG